MEIQFNNFAYKPYIILASGGSVEFEKSLSRAFKRYFAEDENDHSIKVSAYYPCSTRIKVEFTDNGKPFRCFVSMTDSTIEEMFDIEKQINVERPEEQSAFAPTA